MIKVNKTRALFGLYALWPYVAAACSFSPTSDICLGLYVFLLLKTACICLCVDLHLLSDLSGRLILFAVLATSPHHRRHIMLSTIFSIRNEKR